MPAQTLMRIAAILLTAIAFFAFSANGRVVQWQAFVYALAFCHYFIALYYSRAPLERAINTLSYRWRFLSLLFLGVMLYLGHFSIAIYFGLHHALNEAYLSEKDAVKAAPIRRLSASAACFDFFIYLFILRSNKTAVFVRPDLLCLAAWISGVAFFYFLFRARPFFRTGAELVEHCAAEIGMIVILSVSFFTPVRFLHIVAYHFIYWGLRPLPRLHSGPSADLWRYVLMTLGLFGVMYLLSPVGIRKYPMEGSIFFGQFLFWSYFHITSSFALSDANPGWIRRFFRPQAV